MSLLADLRVRVGADISEFQTKMGMVKGEIGGFGALDKVASVGIIGLAAVIAGVSVVSFKMATDFQSSVAQIAVNAQIPQKAADDIGKAFLTTAGQSTFSAKTMADAFGPVAGKLAELKGSALSIAESLNIMKVSGDLAEATGQDLATTTKALSDVMIAYHMPLSAAAGATDNLFNASRIANVGVDTIAAAVDKMHSRLGDATPSLATTSGLLVDLSDHGLVGGRGLMQVTSAMMQLEKGGKPVDDLLHTMGASLTDATGATLPLTAVFAQLQPKLLAMAPAQREAAMQTLFHVGSSSALGKVVMEGAAGLQNHIDTVSKVGSAHAGAVTKTDTLAGQVKILKATFDDAMVTIGLKMIPAVDDLAQKAMPGLIAATGWISDHLSTIAPILGVVVGLFIGWKVALAAHAVITGIWSIATGAATVATGLWTAAQWLFNAAMDANPIGLIVLAIGLLVVAAIYVVTHWKEVSAFFKGLWEPIAGFFKSAWDKITGFLSGVWTNISNTTSNIWNGITDFFKKWGPFLLIVLTGGLALIPLWILQHWQQISDTTKNIWNAITAWLGGIWNGIADTVKNVWNGIANTASNLWNNITNAIKGPVNAVAGWLGGVWSGITTGIQNAWNGILNWVGGIVGKIVDAITGPFKNIHIPMPHFEFGQTQMDLAGVKFAAPTVNVKWYAKGGIFDSPTVLGGGVGVGEAGPEAAAPISELAKYLPDNSPKIIEAIHELTRVVVGDGRDRTNGNLDKNALLRALGSLMADYNYANSRGLMRPA